MRLNPQNPAMAPGTLARLVLVPKGSGLIANKRSRIWHSLTQISCSLCGNSGSQCEGRTPRRSVRQPSAVHVVRSNLPVAFEAATANCCAADGKRHALSRTDCWERPHHCNKAVKTDHKAVTTVL
jgi:hypothetical protein